MMNTIEYRVDCQLLTYLHEENALGCRFPIGLTEQVKTWPHDTLKAFWERWCVAASRFWGGAGVGQTGGGG